MNAQLFSESVPRRHKPLEIDEIVARYKVTDSPEEAAGLIHAARERAYLGHSPLDRTVRFLTEVGSGVTIIEPSAHLRDLARKVLFRHLILRCRSKRDARDIVLAFLTDGPMHFSRASHLPQDNRDKKDLVKFLTHEWECQFSDDADQPDRGLVVRATVLAGAFELLSQFNVFEAIPVLYVSLREAMEDSGDPIATSVCTPLASEVWSGLSRTDAAKHQLVETMASPAWRIAAEADASMMRLMSTAVEQHEWEQLVHDRMHAMAAALKELVNYFSWWVLK